MAKTDSKQQKLPFIVKDSPVGGRGAFARKNIPSGSLIIEYKGKKRKWADCEEDPEFYVYYFSIDDDTVLDPFTGGNEARFINHSCEPNCQAVQSKKKIFIYSIRDIKKGEELYYDYGLETGRRITKAEKQKYACCCKAPSCRGTMLSLGRK